MRTKKITDVQCDFYKTVWKSEGNNNYKLNNYFSS